MRCGSDGCHENERKKCGGQRETTRGLLSKAKDEESHLHPSVPGGIFRMPSQRAIFSFNHSLTWAEGLHQLLPVGLCNFLFAACSCRKAMVLFITTRNERMRDK